MNRKIGSIVVAGTVAATTLAGVALAGTASAATPAGPAAVSAGSQAAALSGDWTWTITRVDSYVWNANVRITAGRHGAYTRCSDGTQLFGPQVGPGYWAFGGECYGHGTLSAFSVY
ncbi:hypothetical protein [Kitasatospora sp. NPDC002040]|uniref:hypothetical protein n=1 Tax=Kitasatospora sp. NPDC002040 TaxID=3154661 RepID=UPI003328E784